MRRGFTLIELLVVVAIIAILAAILFPVFAQAKATAKATACMSNLTQMSRAVAMYAGDHDDLTPVTGYMTGPYEFATWHDILDPYVKNKDVWHCPSSGVKKQDGSGKPTTHWGYNVLYLTTLLPDMSNVSGHSGLPMSSAEDVAGTVLFTDAKASLAYSWCGDDGKFLLPPSRPDADCWGRPNPIHAEGVNIVWLDGHSKARKPSGFYSGQTPMDRWFDLQ